MKIIGYSRTYAGGLQLARAQGYGYMGIYCVASNEAPLRYTVMVAA